MICAFKLNSSAENWNDSSPHILILRNRKTKFSDPLFLNRRSTFITRVLEDTELKILWDQVGFVHFVKRKSCTLR